MRQQGRAAQCASRWYRGGLGGIGGLGFFSRAFHVGGFGAPLVVSAELWWSRRPRVLRGIPCWPRSRRFRSVLLVMHPVLVSGMVWGVFVRLRREETCCSGCRGSRRSEQAPCVKKYNQQPVNRSPHSVHPCQKVVQDTATTLGVAPGAGGGGFGVWITTPPPHPGLRRVRAAVGLGFGSRHRFA